MEKLHPKAIWLFFFRAFFALSFFTVFIFIPFSPLISSIKDYLSLGSLIIITLLLIAIFSYIWARLTYRFWLYELDENAVKIEKGVITKKYITIPYERIQNIDIYRGIFARLFGLSDLQIQTAGYSNYKQHSQGSEGRLPGLGVQKAESLREQLVKKIKGTDQGL